MTPYTFDEQKRYSEGISGEAELLDHVVKCIPSAIKATEASREDDIHGTDFWIERWYGLRKLSLDFKHRKICPISRYGSDDVCVELVSQYKSKTYSPPIRRELIHRIGWTLDPKKQTDLVVYTWPSDVGRRFWIVSFPFLCHVAREHAVEWQETFRVKPTANETYLTLCVYPPRKYIMQEIDKLTIGEVAA